MRFYKYHLTQLITFWTIIARASIYLLKKLVLKFLFRVISKKSTLY